MIPTDPRRVMAEYDSLIHEVRHRNWASSIARKKRNARQPWYAQGLDLLLCELDSWRLVLAGRLARFAKAQSLLHADQAHVISVGCCD
jgi:hypothetical protein